MFYVLKVTGYSDTRSTQSPIPFLPFCFLSMWGSVTTGVIPQQIPAVERGVYSSALLTRSTLYPHRSSPRINPSTFRSLVSESHDSLDSKQHFCGRNHIIERRKKHRNVASTNIPAQAPAQHLFVALVGTHTRNHVARNRTSVNNWLD